MKYLTDYTGYLIIAWIIVGLFSDFMKIFMPSKYTKDIDEFEFNVITIGGIVIALTFLLELIASLIIWLVMK